MPSPAVSRYKVAINRARTLRKTATDVRLRPMSQEQVQIYYHAALAAYVAAWETHIEKLVRDFYDTIANPLDREFNAVYELARQNAERALERFNAPNWDNTRHLLVYHTGYDPINDWIWSKRTMSVLDTKNRLNEILQVRHSFAHGFPMQSYAWNQSSSGNIRLTSRILEDIELFFNHLVKVTDAGIKNHIISFYQVRFHW